MKQMNPYLKALFAYLLIVLMTGCGIEDPEAFLDDVTDGIVLNVNTDIFRVPLAIQLTNANQTTLWKQEHVQIQVLGVHASEIYATNGRRTLTFSDGFVEIGVDRTRTISEGNPLEFVVNVQSEGFLPVSKKVILQDTTFRLLTVSMVEKAALPKGTAAQDTVFMIEDNGNQDTIVLETAVVTEQQAPTTVEIAPETQLMGEDTETLKGEVSSQLVYFDGTNTEAQQAFPGGLVTNSAKDSLGNDLGAVEVLPVGFISFDIFLGNEEVKTFSKPVSITLPINELAINPVMDRAFVAGDQIPVWSLNEDSGEWQEEGIAIVASEENGLVARFAINHLSWWSLHYVNEGACDGSQPIAMNISSPFSADCTAPIYYWELWDETNNTLIGTGQFLSVKDSSTHFLFDIPNEKVVYLDMYDQKDAACRSLLYRSNTMVTSCNGTFDIDLNTELASLQPYVIQATMSGICRGSGSDLIVRPNFNVYYRNDHCEVWNFLGEAENGFFCTANLQKGDTYDFRAFYGEATYDFEAVTIENQSIDYNGYTVDITLGADGADLEISEVVLDDEFCSLVQ